MRRVQNEKSQTIIKIRSDRGTEFVNGIITQYCVENGIAHELSAARTPQQNGVAERRNRTLKEAARTMLAEARLPKRFWSEAINTTCYTQNRCMINRQLTKTPYEIWTGKKPNVGYFKIFGCK